ncbi:uncharacterized protein [Procambarus clarkii]|uniref:uncharacterized protein n=1 Tax=Procambarus clarkii TaxID=6728 RepID=UPI0037441AFA
MFKEEDFPPLPVEEDSGSEEVDVPFSAEAPSASPSMPPDVADPPPGVAAPSAVLLAQVDVLAAPEGLPGDLFASSAPSASSSPATKHGSPSASDDVRPEPKHSRRSSAAWADVGEFDDCGSSSDGGVAPVALQSTVVAEVHLPADAGAGVSVSLSGGVFVGPDSGASPVSDGSDSSWGVIPPAEVRDTFYRTTTTQLTPSPQIPNFAIMRHISLHWLISSSSLQERATSTTFKPKYERMTSFPTLPLVQSSGGGNLNVSQHYPSCSHREVETLMFPNITPRAVIGSHTASDAPSHTASDAPSHTASDAPSHTASDAPSHTASDAPSHTASDAPSHTASDAPSHTASDAPSHTASDAPSHTASDAPSHTASDAPSHTASDAPSHTASDAPSHTASDAPSHTASDAPSHTASDAPSHTASDAPSHTASK